MAEFFANLGNTSVLAVLTIILVGCFKFIPPLKNMKNKGVRKAIYQILSLVISAGLATLDYIFLLKGAWGEALIHFITLTVAEVNALYPLYENLGLRALVKKLFSLLIPSKADRVSEVVDTVIDTVALPASSDETAKKQEEAERTGWLQ